jgi:nitroimidazol reductase NimA-like FMN-containing flavoprotein (pyridoxamine 5'-phosphate oxidase superfamily)
VGHLGCHADGTTYVIPLSYAYDNKAIYVRASNGLKMDLMKKNPSVCFQVDNTKDLSNWQSAICWGNFRELTDPGEISYAVKLLADRVLPLVSSETMHIGRDWPFSAADAAKPGGKYFSILITKKTGRFEKLEEGEYYAT